MCDAHVRNGLYECQHYLLFHSFTVMIQNDSKSRGLQPWCFFDAVFALLLHLINLGILTAWRIYTAQATVAKLQTADSVLLKVTPVTLVSEKESSQVWPNYSRGSQSYTLSVKLFFCCIVRAFHGLEKKYLGCVWRCMCVYGCESAGVEEWDWQISWVCVPTNFTCVRLGT